MGSLLSSDNSKSAPASPAPRPLERSRDPELPITSFDCSVCLEVLHQPVRTRCGHVFCRSCIATSIKNHKWTCPYCRAYLPSEGVPATDIAKRMKSEYQNCTECGTLVCLSDMRTHIRTCEKYIDKYGPLQELGETTTRCVCPFCQKELEEDCLLDHCITYHRSERRPVFCPLCHLLPNESPSTFNGSLIRHLQVSHTLFYDDFIDFDIIEEALIRRVLDRSLLEYVNHSNTTLAEESFEHFITFLAVSYGKIFPAELVFATMDLKSSTLLESQLLSVQNGISNHNLKLGIVAHACKENLFKIFLSYMARSRTA